MNPVQAYETLADYLDANQNALLIGKPGVGKTDIAFQSAHERKWPTYLCRAVLKEPVDWSGVPSIQDGFTIWNSPAELPREDRDGSEGLIILDEITGASPQMQNALLGFCLDGTFGGYTKPKGWRIVATGNYTTDGAGAARLTSALKDRFGQIDVEPCAQSFVSYCNRTGVDPIIPAYISWNNDAVHTLDVNGKGTSPRSLVMASKFVRLPEERRTRALLGLLGESATADLAGFIDVYEHINLADILANPSTANLPNFDGGRKNCGLAYAIASALSRVANRANFANVITYADRMAKEGSPEFGVLAIVEAVRRDSSLAATGAFTTWIHANPAVQP